MPKAKKSVGGAARNPNKTLGQVCGGRVLIGEGIGGLGVHCINHFLAVYLYYTLHHLYLHPLPRSH